MSDKQLDDDRGEYDLATPPAPAPPLPVLPVEAIDPEADEPPALEEPPELAYRAPQDDKTPADVETIKNLWMPLWLLGAGVAIEVVGAFVKARDIRIALADIGFNIIAGTAFMLVGVWLAARWREINLGDIRTAAFKLAAISVAPHAAVTLLSPVLDHVIFGSLIGFAVMFVAYFALLGALFDLDQSDTWYCICVIILVRLAVYFGLLAIGAVV
jgi:hypothetical protein